MKLLYIDLFCGAGGTSTGVSSARINGEKCADVIACVNHDANAIASHASNHPNALHFTEDIRTLDLSPLITHVERKRIEYPDAFVVLWASLECTNFSKAKGGQPRDADSRTLAEHLFRYIEALKPDYIQIENVEEFMSWGDMDENGKPISMDKGKSYTRWVQHVKRYGYKFDYRILNAADYGAYTSPTVITKDRLALINSVFIDNQYGTGRPTSVEQPVGTVTTVPKFNMVSCKPWIMNTAFSNVGSSIESPSQVITANRKWHYLINPQFSSIGGCIDNPCFTLIARMDKKSPYLVVAETGDVAIVVFETDSSMTVKIKEFMALYCIIDIKMRMLRISELKRIMGFPENYKLIGTQAEQKKFIGNAVEVNMARVLCEAICKELIRIKQVV